ncbi:hypothetical protein GB931_21180 [Modestobacter sp. I12A-02628]|uniref:Low molecular weight protein antigen 6 PH domain-containing protein n=1 Tax=Goekera deserti TaxID=2497753 RepID=A0A7K3WFW5_9ACTN|nr:PH domain-containing protein [Goekera deserti]MPR00387.1 hypothetical protein [Goekera deserti]NEL55324.1 hypothetical protein [Goekera deserti]
MTHPSEMVVIRPPLVFRVLFVGVLVFAVATFLGPLLLDTLRDGDTGLLVFLVPFSLLWCGFFVRAVLLSVSTTADGRLRVVNRLRTTTYERADIEDVRLPPRGMQGVAQGAMLQLELRDGSSVRLDATASLPWRGAALEDQHRRLRAWLQR